MPLPLLIPIALGAAGLFGLGKTAKAAIDNHEAGTIADMATAMVEDAEKSLDTGKDDCNTSLRVHGEQKLQVISEDIQAFIDLFGRLKNVTLENSAELDGLSVGDFTEVSLAELKHSCSFARDIASSTVTGTGAGALTAFGAYSGTMMLASAGTGTAIGTLSGVAATNATLAWLGGGTLAAGGYGVAGGTMVLGVLVAGPALLVLGAVLGARASKKLDEAKADMQKAEVYFTEVRLVLEKIRAIIDVTLLGDDLLVVLKTRLQEANMALKETIKISGDDYSTYTADAKDTVFRAVKFAQLVKAVVDTPILDEDGSLADGALLNFQLTKEILEKE